jgi:hypothetical protein
MSYRSNVSLESVIVLIANITSFKQKKTAVISAGGKQPKLAELPKR